ncbi:MAG: hypothetical protein WAW10_02885 [Gallionella sp.]
MRASHIAFVLMVACPFASQAQLKDENLLQNVPPGYKIASQVRQGNAAITQMVPDGESLKDWSETLAINVFLGEKNATVEQFQDFHLKRWLNGCPERAAVGGIKPVAKGTDNGYPYAIWAVSCKRSPVAGPSEFAWMKAIKGNDSFYVIQKSFRSEPSPEQVAHWVQYLAKLSVCDTRLPDRACPSLDNVVTSKPAPTATTFDGETFTKKFVGSPPAGDKLIEFVRESESFENWTKLIGYRYQQLPGLENDPEKAAVAMAQVVKATNPQAQLQIIANKKSNEALISFVTWPPDHKYTEVNVFRYAKSADGKALVSLQVACRLAVDASMEGIAKLWNIRSSWTNMAAEFDMKNVHSALAQ